MKLNLNKFLFAFSYALDFVEIDLLGLPTNHSKRVAYISYNIGKELGLNSEELFDLVSLSILHDNGASQKLLHDKISNKDVVSIENLQEHCIIGENNIRKFPFLTDVKNIIKYHHENYNGTGFYGLMGDEIPLMSQIIYFADVLENNFNLKKSSLKDKDEVIKFITDNENILFSSSIIKVFIKVSSNVGFWLDLKDDYINQSLERLVPKYYKELDWYEIREITSVISAIIDSKSKYPQTPNDLKNSCIASTS